MLAARHVARGRHVVTRVHIKGAALIHMQRAAQEPSIVAQVATNAAARETMYTVAEVVTLATLKLEIA